MMDELRGMRRGPTVADAMRREVPTVEIAASIATAARRMRRYGVGALPVLESRRVVGMVTDRDLVLRGLAVHPNIGPSQVGAVMSVAPLTIDADRPLEEAEQLMADAGIRRLIVVDEAQRLAGLLSWHDIGDLPRRGLPSQQVGFYRRICDSHGQPHRVELSRLYLSPAVAANEAEGVAIRRFESVNGGNPWWMVADDYQVEYA